MTNQTTGAPAVQQGSTKEASIHPCESLMHYCAHSGHKVWSASNIMQASVSESFECMSLANVDKIERITDEQRVAFLEKSAKTDASKPLHAPQERLRQVLLRVSGRGTYALIPNIEEDVYWLLKYGQLWGKTHKMMRAAQSQCHSNSCYLMEQNAHLPLFVATGYALSDDGLWRQHSWCVLKRPRGTKVIETTVPRLAYFGFVLSADQTLEFANNNTDFGIDLGQAKHVLMEDIQREYVAKQALVQKVKKGRQDKEQTVHQQQVNGVGGSHASMKR